MPTSYHQPIIDEFRATGGKVTFFPDGDLLLLTTTGARSRQQHTVPLGYVPHGDHLLVVGSAAGADRHPAWFHNLVAHPAVHVEVGIDAFDAIAVPATDRRDELFEAVVRVAPGYADYQAGTDRVLPVVVLHRAAGTFAGKLLEVHGWLREQIAQVRAEAEGQPSLGLQLRRHCAAFCDALTFHHTGEDEHVFPGIEVHHPHLADALARLREEHQAVARLKDRLLTATDSDLFRGDLERMAEELGEHLDREEAWLLPVLADVPWPPVAA